MASRPRTPRPLLIAAPVAVAAGLLLAVLGFYAGGDDSSSPDADAGREAASDEGPADQAEAEPPQGETTQPGGEEDTGVLGRDADDEDAARSAEVGAPKRIEIPSIDVDSDIVPVGLKPDGAMEVPDFGLAGWYTEGPAPGEEGPSTVVAHVDSRAGPDVFARLRELDPGDEVRIHGEDGAVTFVVEGSERAPKDELPEDRIWGWTNEPTLRLITCDGWFDQSVGHYEDNLIVYLSIADS